MAPLVSGGVYRNPVGMRIVNVLVGCVRIGPRDHIHAEFPATGKHFTEWIGIAEKFATVVQRNSSGIKRHAAAGAQTGGIGMNPLEVIEPEGGTVTPWIVLHECKLGPAHRAIVPTLRAGGLSGSGQRESRGDGGRLKGKISSG